MTLTVVVGSSGSGKTTFLNDLYQKRTRFSNAHNKDHHGVSKQMIYIRQFHNLRPYLVVSQIPNFDPTQLPYWNIYVDEEKDLTIQVGGTLAGEYTAGLSGGQRKLFLFELICQRTRDQSNLLIALDEPFLGVTTDFVPFLIKRLVGLSKQHNVVLVTNDHVAELTGIADNVIQISTLDRSIVHIIKNNKEQPKKENEEEESQVIVAERELVLFVLSSSQGEAFQMGMSNHEDFMFFVKTEILNSQALIVCAVLSALSFGIILVTFWNSQPDLAALVLIASGLISLLVITPYILSLVDWRIAMEEEAEALIHSSKTMNRILKAALTVSVVILVSLTQFGVVNAVVDGLSSIDNLIGMLSDSFSLTMGIWLGIFTAMDFESVQIYGCIPFAFSLFFSTTYSPGSGLAVLKELRFLCTRFFFWCLVPGVQDTMEGCPNTKNKAVLFMILTSMIGVGLLLVWKTLSSWRQKRYYQKHVQARRETIKMDPRFIQLQRIL